MNELKNDMIQDDAIVSHLNNLNILYFVGKYQ